jgi:hypothetical protein
MAFKEPRAFVDRKFQIRRSLLFVVVMVYALACCDRSCSLGIKESCHFSYSTTNNCHVDVCCLTLAYRVVQTIS